MATPTTPGTPRPPSRTERRVSWSPEVPLVRFINEMPLAYAAPQGARATQLSEAYDDIYKKPVVLKTYASRAEALANQTGSKFFARAVPELETAAPALTALRGVDAERNIALSKRIKLLTSKGDGRLLAGKALHQGQWEFPAFAREIALTTLCFQMRLGSYKELSADDRRRRYIAAMTDIADRSNAVVGYGWWVKR
jgi:hypothetical protein